jgi:hypothetical protein
MAQRLRRSAGIRLAWFSWLTFAGSEQLTKCKSPRQFSASPLVWTACASLLAALAIGGCQVGTDESRLVGGTPLGKNGRLLGDPPPLTLEAVDRLPDGSAEQEILRTLYWAQLGSTPNVLTTYDELVRETLGPDITNAYSFGRGALVNTYPEITEVSASPAGKLVAVTFYSRNMPSRRESFLLRRGPEGWSIIYDTLLDRLLVTARFRSGDPRGADRSVRRYRSLFSVGSEPGGRDRDAETRRSR